MLDSPNGDAAERRRARQFLMSATFGTGVMIGQGGTLHDELGEILGLIDAAGFD